MFCIALFCLAFHVFFIIAWGNCAGQGGMSWAFGIGNFVLYTFRPHLQVPGPDMTYPLNFWNFNVCYVRVITIRNRIISIWLYAILPSSIYYITCGIYSLKAVIHKALYLKWLLYFSKRETLANRSLQCNTNSPASNSDIRYLQTGHQISWELKGLYKSTASQATFIIPMKLGGTILPSFSHNAIHL